MEKATYKEIVTHLEGEWELNGLEKSADIPVPTMSRAQAEAQPGNGLLPLGINPGTNCNYCKKLGHIRDDCRKLKRKEGSKRKDGQSSKNEYPKCPTCDNTNHPGERCWKGSGAHLKPKNNLKLENSKSYQPTTKQNDVNNKPFTSIIETQNN